MVDCISEFPFIAPVRGPAINSLNRGARGDSPGVFYVYTKTFSMLSIIIINNYCEELLLNSVKIFDGALFRSEIPKKGSVVRAFFEFSAFGGSSTTGSAHCRCLNA